MTSQGRSMPHANPSESPLRDIDAARGDLTRSSGGGIGFFLAYSLTLLIAGVLAFFLPRDVAALVILFQGGVALPLAFALERALGFPPMAPDNPLRPLAIQVAMVQIVALPGVILVYQLDPNYVPAAFAAIGGGHFLPYVWMHRNRAYLALAIATAVLPFLMMSIWGEDAFPFIPLLWAALYATMAITLRLTHRAPQAAGQPV